MRNIDAFLYLQLFSEMRDIALCGVLSEGFPVCPSLIASLWHRLQLYFLWGQCATGHSCGMTHRNRDLTHRHCFHSANESESLASRTCLEYLDVGQSWKYKGLKYNKLCCSEQHLSKAH